MRFILLLGAAATCTAPLAEASPAEARNQEQLVALMKDLRAQQAELAANQAKIDEKLAAVAEAVRLARIYSSRAGR